jgi:hypothetical protein
MALGKTAKIDGREKSEREAKKSDETKNLKR